MLTRFSGDVTNLTDAHLNLVSDVFTKEGYAMETIHVSPVGKKGDNYVADVQRFVSNKDGKTLSIVAKIAPTSQGLRVIMNTAHAFKNEIVLYSTVLPKLVDYQKRAGHKQKDWFRYPICYGYLDTEPNEIILLEDLKCLNYNVRDRFKSLTDQEVRLVLQNQAKLHALGFLLRIKEPEYFQMIDDNLVNLWDAACAGKEYTNSLKVIADRAAQIVQPNKKEFVRDAVRNMAINGKSLRDEDRSSVFSTVIQGDSWTNNIMFTSGTEQTDCILIDYQIADVTSPVFDVLYAILNCTDRATRKRNFYKWLDYYHTTLSENLHDLELDVASIYPRERFDKDINRYGNYMFGLSVFLINLLSRDGADVMVPKDMEETDTSKEYERFLQVNGEEECTRLRFEKGLNELTQCCTEYGFIE